MKLLLCFAGMVIISLATLLWISSSSSGVYSLTASEFKTLLFLGMILIAPKAMEAVKTFLTSGREMKNLPF